MSQLNFSVAYATSQCEANPASNIINSSPYSAGWISMPNSPLPQQVILDFGMNVLITQLQFVSHQTKIAADIMISTAKESSNWRVANFTDLEAFSFSDNSQNDYKAREIRTANFANMKLRFLKLSFNRIHPNRFNLSNQIGLVSVTAFGVSDTDATSDPEIARLEREKREAVENENFALAQRLKDRIANLRENRQQLLELARMKEEAAQREDFITAERIKNQIARIQSGQAAEPYVNEAPMMEPVIDEPIIPHRQQRVSLANDSALDQDLPISAPAAAPAPPVDDYYAPPPRFDYVEDDRAIHPAPNGDYTWDDRLGNPDDNFVDEPLPEPTRKRRQIPQDDRPIRGRREVRDHRPPEPSEDPGEDPVVEQLTTKQQQEAEPFIEQCGEMSVREFYSKATPNRVRGIKKIAEAINSTRGSQRAQLFVKFCHMLKDALSGDMLGVYAAATDAIISLCKAPGLSNDVIRAAVEAHLPGVVKRLGDKKIGRQAMKFVTWASDHVALGVQSVAPLLMAPVRKHVPANMVEKLNLVRMLLETYGTVDNSFDTGPIIEFVLMALESKSADVRASASDVCSVLAGMGAGSQIIKALGSSTLPPQTQNLVKKKISGE